MARDDPVTKLTYWTSPLDGSVGSTTTRAGYLFKFKTVRGRGGGGGGGGE